MGNLGGVAKFWEWLKTQLPAIVIALFTFEESRLDLSVREGERKDLTLELKDNHEKIIKTNALKSDSDIINEFLASADSPTKPTDPKKT
jgi:hypothetical protein